MRLRTRTSTTNRFHRWQLSSAIVIIVFGLWGCGHSATDADPISTLTWAQPVLGTNLHYVSSELDSDDKPIPNSSLEFNVTIDSADFSAAGHSHVWRLTEEIGPDPVFISYDDNGDLWSTPWIYSPNVTDPLDWMRFPFKSRNTFSTPLFDTMLSSGVRITRQTINTFDGTDVVVIGGVHFSCARVLSNYLTKVTDVYGTDSTVANTSIWYSPTLACVVRVQQTLLYYDYNGEEVYRSAILTKLTGFTYP